MKAVFRILSLLLLIAGAGAGVAWPWYVGQSGGREIGRWAFVRDADAFQPLSLDLPAGAVPVAVGVQMRTSAATLPSGTTVLALTVDRDGRTLLARALDFAGQPRRLSPQIAEYEFSAEAGTLEPGAGGPHLFTLARGDADEVPVISAELVLRGAGPALDPRIQPLGLALAALGFMGLVASFRRRPTPNPNSQPPAPRWGRNGGAGPN